MLKKLLQQIVPQKLRRRLSAYIHERGQARRAKRESQIPKVPLSAEHAKNCQVVLNRSALLARLKKGGTVAEIGVDTGHFSDLIIEITEPALLHLVDAWGSDRYHAGLAEAVASKFSDLIQDNRVQIHRKLSIDAAQDFEDDYFDWIYIDTDHSYETTRDELIKYAPKVKKDGLITGHDYSMGNWVKSYRYGVIEAVHEFCVNYGWELVYITLEPTENQSFAIRRLQQG